MEQEPKSTSLVEGNPRENSEVLSQMSAVFDLLDEMTRRKISSANDVNQLQAEIGILEGEVAGFVTENYDKRGSKDSFSVKRIEELKDGRQCHTSINCSPSPGSPFFLNITCKRSFEEEEPGTCRRMTICFNPKRRRIKYFASQERHYDQGSNEWMTKNAELDF